uniref:Uncharacterized protein n=1 Tax=Pararge aegeria TaxID=116150 RepID=S4P338_9NEOP
MCKTRRALHLDIKEIMSSLSISPYICKALNVVCFVRRRDSRKSAGIFFIFSILMLTKFTHCNMLYKLLWVNAKLDKISVSSFFNFSKGK